MSKIKPLVLGTLGGLLGTYISSVTFLPELIDDYYESSANKFRVEFYSNIDFDDISSLIDDELFRSSDEENSFLESKIGFEFDIDNFVYSKKIDNAPSIALFYDKFGSSYSFEVRKSSSGAYETLSISNYEGKLNSSILIFDFDNDGVIDRLYVTDKTNNTELSVSRDLEGELVYENVNEEGAREIFLLYSLEYLNFKKKYDVDERIFNYSPKFELRQNKITLEKSVHQ